MAAKRAEHLPSLNVPDLNRRIIRARSKYVVIKLKAGDAILVALEGLDGAASRLPVVANLEAVAVHVLPWSKFAFGVELALGIAGAVEAKPLRGAVVLFDAPLRRASFRARGLGLAVGCLLVAAPGLELLLFQKRETPAALGALAVNVLLAHAVPHDVVVGQVSPSAADLGCLAQRNRVEVAENSI